MAACFIFCLTTVLTGVIVAGTTVTGNATVIIVSKKGNWSEAKQDCLEIYNGELVPAGDVTCSLLPTRYTQSIWSGGYKVPSWVKSEGCYKLEGNLTRLVNPPNLSLEKCISTCTTRHVGFKKEAGKCMCFESINGLTKMQSTSPCINQCIGSSCIFIPMYTVTNASVDIDNESCIGLYLNCKERYPAILPANCSSLHGRMCENGELKASNGLYNQSQAISSCDINNDVLMADFNKTCAALNGRTAWTSIKLIWIDPVFPDKGRYEQHNINYCTYTQCANNGQKGILLSGNCSKIIDGYACKIMDPTKQVGSIEMTETGTSANTNEVQKPTLTQRESTVDTTDKMTDTVTSVSTNRTTRLISTKGESTADSIIASSKYWASARIDTMSTDVSGHAQTTHISTEMTQEKMETNNGTTIGIIVAVLVVAAVTITTVVLLLLRRSKRKSQSQGNSTVSKNNSQHGSFENYESPWDSEGSKTNSLVLQSVLSMSTNGSVSKSTERPDIDLTTYAVVYKAGKAETAFQVQAPTAAFQVQDTNSDNTIKNEPKPSDEPEDEYDKLDRISKPAIIETLSDNVYDCASGSRDTGDATYNTMDRDGSWREGKAATTLNHYS